MFIGVQVIYKVGLHIECNDNKSFCHPLASSGEISHHPNLEFGGFITLSTRPLTFISVVFWQLGKVQNVGTIRVQNSDTKVSLMAYSNMHRGVGALKLMILKVHYNIIDKVNT